MLAGVPRRAPLRRDARDSHQTAEMPSPTPCPSPPWRTAAASLLAAALAAGCSLLGPPHKPLYEDFAAEGRYARSFPAASAETCQAARRALLSQGYVVQQSGNEQVDGRKQFQPEAETHVEVAVRVVCAPESAPDGGSVAFVSAQQDRYALKKSSSAASVGVGVLGSVSLPFSSGNDSLVKVASETIAADLFYERFFALVGRYLADPDRVESIEGGNALDMPLPADAASAPRAARPAGR